MWQHLLRNWLMQTARERMQEAARNAATGESRAADDRPFEPHPTGPAQPPVCHVGLVFALGIEAGGLVDRLAGAIATTGARFVAREGGLEGRRLVIIESGAGCEAAARCTEALIAGHKPRWLISAGFAGALSEEMKRGHILMADEVVDVAGRRLKIDLNIDRAQIAASPGLHVGRLLTVDRVVHRAADKLALGREHGALAVDMETFGVAEVCRQEKVKLLSIRVISDCVDRELPADVDLLVRKKTTAGRIGAATGAIFRRPSSLKDMWQLREDALVASERLAKFIVGVVRQLDG